jgi:hypothetical protein
LQAKGLVKPFRIAALHSCEGSVYEDFHEGQRSVFVHLMFFSLVPSWMVLSASIYWSGIGMSKYVIADMGVS